MQTLTLNSSLIPEALERSIDYRTYFEQVKSFYEQQKTSGEEQSQSRIEFTALNYQRMKRLNKTISINEVATQFLKNVKKSQAWLVITEDWCGDSAQVIPVINKMAEQATAIELKLVYRDEQPELMDAFLTNGGRSIPKLIAIDKNNDVLFTWGPRPSVATKMVADYKEKHGLLTPEFKQELQAWYNKDKGESIVDDLTKLLEKY
jgi:thiol-disulfide isomerase/thioredoxin